MYESDVHSLSDKKVNLTLSTAEVLNLKLFSNVRRGVDALQWCSK